MFKNKFFFGLKDTFQFILTFINLLAIFLQSERYRSDLAKINSEFSKSTLMLIQNVEILSMQIKHLSKTADIGLQTALDKLSTSPKKGFAEIEHLSNDTLIYFITFAGLVFISYYFFGFGYKKFDIINIGKDVPATQSFVNNASSAPIIFQEVVPISRSSGIADSWADCGMSDSYDLDPELWETRKEFLKTILGI